ncbi:MAG: CbtB domain-containing protein [Alphaproteobacteria bacterium]|jgi:cobalt transporter subunit CbtB
MIEDNATTQNDPTVAKTAALLPAVLAMIFGIFLVLGAGFAQPTSMHNAAHDTRHANAFPCH